MASSSEFKVVELLVLELGAGGGLPGIVTAKNGAKSVSNYFDSKGVRTVTPFAGVSDRLPRRAFTEESGA